MPGKVKRNTLLTFAVLACIPGAFFSLLWLAAHAFPDSIGSLVHVDPKHPHPDSSVVGIIFLLFALENAVAFPICLIAIVLGFILLTREDVSKLSRVLLASLIALSIAGTVWVAEGMR